MTYFLEQNLNLKMNFLDGGTKVCFLNFQISEFWATAFFFWISFGPLLDDASNSWMPQGLTYFGLG